MPAVHKVFRTSLRRGPSSSTARKGDDARRALIANYYANLMAFLESHHHGEEELIFPQLIERSAGTKGRRRKGRVRARRGGGVDGRRQEQHECVGCRGGLQRRRRGAVRYRPWTPPSSPTSITRRPEILPLAAANMTVEEWGELPGHAMGSFQGDKIWLIMGLIRENFSPQQRDQMLAHMPPPAVQMWETMGESSFKSMIAEVRQGL